MALTIEAIYENGVLKPSQPLPLDEHETVRITIEPQISWTERTAGMLKWTGDPDVLRRIAEDDEFSLMEAKWPGDAEGLRQTGEDDGSSLMESS